MMFRVLAVFDLITCPEVHFGVVFPTPAMGISTGTHVALSPWAWRTDSQCLLGPIPANNPMQLGHDAGVLRPHVLIDLSPLPPPPAPPAVPVNSAVTSAMATLNSALKPMFSCSQDLRGGGPVAVEMLPYGAGIICSGDTPCGVGGPHRGIPMIPTQLQDWSGMTLGDFLGGLAAMAVETAIQAGIETLGAAIPGGKYVGPGALIPTFFAWVAPHLPIVSDLSGTNVAPAVQVAVDGAVNGMSSSSASASPGTSPSWATSSPSSSSPSAPASPGSSPANGSPSSAGSTGALSSSASPTGSGANGPDNANPASDSGHTGGAGGSDDSSGSNGADQGVSNQGGQDQDDPYPADWSPFGASV